MITIDDVAQQFADIANLLDNMTIKGISNARLMCEAFDICSNTVTELKQSINELSKESNLNDSNNLQKVGEDNGKLITDSEST